MQIHMTFRHLDATDALKARVNEKSERLRKFVGEETEANWVCFIEADNHVAELHVVGPHIDFFAQSKTSDMYQSIDDVSEKMEKQLRKNKEILKDHLHRNGRVAG